MSQIKSNRLDGYDLHPSHEWWKNDGDCWHGDHSYMWCKNCEVSPFGPAVCYHELRGKWAVASDLGKAPCQGEK